MGIDMGKLEDYGLDDSEILGVAIQLSPELFAALAIANRLDASRFPLVSDDDIEALIAEAAGEEDSFQSPGVRITPSEAKDRFPNDFLPIQDRHDLIRKIYMAIVIAHEADSRSRLESARASAQGFEPSHPLDLEVL